MNLNFVARKKYRSDEVQELLTISENEQKFTNNGPVKRLLEKELKSFLKLPENKSVVCLSNGTTSLHSLLYVYEIISGKSLRWLTSSFTFPTPVVAGFTASNCSRSH
jgi:dTDP-4-amino-4,6-dideoxygalactose transaminase